MRFFVHFTETGPYKNSSCVSSKKESEATRMFRKHSRAGERVENTNKSKMNAQQWLKLSADLQKGMTKENVIKHRFP